MLRALAARVFGLVTIGCGQAENKGFQPKQKDAKIKPSPVAVAQKDDHSGWWCDAHGVPEEICGQCSAKAAAELKKAGDWCKEHDRPDSHHPERKEKFAAQYRAKYGKEPPPTQEETEERHRSQPCSEGRRSCGCLNLT